MIIKHLPGLLIGAVLTSAAFLLLNRSDDDLDPAPGEIISSNTESQSIDADRGQISSDSGASNFHVDTETQSSEPPNDAGENSSRDNGAVSCPPILPISLPPELEYVRELQPRVGSPADSAAQTAATVPTVGPAGAAGRQDTTGRFKNETDIIRAIDILLAQGLDINATDNNGRTALHGAALGLAGGFGFTGGESRVNESTVALIQTLLEETQ
jgi:hypothetical protein